MQTLRSTAAALNGVDPIIAKREEAKAALQGLNLTEGQRQAAVTKIESAAGSGEIDGIVAEAQALSQARTDASETIGQIRASDRYKFAGLGSQRDFDQGVAGVLRDLNAPNAIASSIRDQLDFINHLLTGVLNGDTQVDQAKSTVANLPHLSQEQKEQFLAELETLRQNPTAGWNELQDLVQKYRDLDAQAALAQAKADAKERINALSNLSSEEREAAIAEVDSADTVDAVNIALTSAEDLDAHHLENAKTQARSDLAALQNLTPEQRQEAEQAINNARTITAVTSAVDDARTKDSANLEAAKQEALPQLDGFANLSQDERDSARNAINGATTIEKVHEELERARALNASKLADAKAAATSALDALTSLSSEQLEAARQAIAGATTVEQVNEALRNAQDLNSQNLAAAKKEAEAAVNALADLSEKEKAEALEKIANAESAEDVEAALAKARELNNTAVADARTAANETIDALRNLTEEERRLAHEAVAAATTRDEVAAAVKKAQEQDAANLAAAQKVAEDAINALPNLSDDEKASAINDVKKALDQAGIDEALQQAQDLNSENLRTAQAAANLTVDALRNLTPQQAEEAKAAINAATTLDEVAAAVKKAQEQDAANLAAVKKTAVDAVNALPNLSDDEKAAAVKDINKAVDQEEIDAAVNAAEELNNSNLNEARATATITVDALRNLTPQQAEEAKAAINAATTLDEVAAAVKKAQEQDAANLAAAKKAAVDAVNTLANLSDDEKATAIKDINKAVDQEEIDAALEQARELNSERLHAAQADATLTIAGLRNLTPQQVEEAKAAINAATTLDEVAAAVKKAQEQDAANLAAAKKAAVDAVNALANLSDDEKAAAIAKINQSIDQDGITEALNDARTLNTQNLADAQAQGVKDVEALANLTPEQLAAAKAAIAGATTRDAVLQAVKNAEAQDAANLAAAKKAAEAAINALPNLSDDEKAAALAEIASATNLAQINATVKTAQDLNAQRLADAQATANVVVEGLVNLTAEQLAQVKAEIAAATTVTEVEAAVKKAQAQDAANLAAAKKAAEAVVNALPNLSDDEKAAAIAEIGKATNQQQIDSAVQDARNLNDNNLAAAKAKAGDDLAMLANLSAEEMKSAKDAVAAATTVTEVQDAVNKAKEQDAANLADAKAKALEELKTLEYLTNPSLFEAQVNNATTVDEVAEVLKAARAANEKGRADYEARKAAEAAAKAAAEAAQKDGEAPKSAPSADTSTEQPTEQPTDAKNLPASGVKGALPGILALALIGLGGAAVAARRRFR